ncbi:MAG TPA: glycosyltransferase family 2 protein [Anaerolineales bacterium]|nr:glycosyltransferase family 2 protein [Anaerolineales bacterium]
MFFSALHAVLLIPLSVLAVLAGYLLLLTIAATRAPKTTVLRDALSYRFLILIPAHNEEQLLPSVLENLSHLDYPPHLFQIHVVADNCTDQTAQIAQQGGAYVHERNDLTQRGKGFALTWLLNRLWATARPTDHPEAVVIIDADTVVSRNFLRVMDARLSRGEQVIQAYYAVRDPSRSWAVSIRYIALAAIHYLRPQGRMVLGGSVGLKGNGMVFAADVMKKHAWTAHLTEDIEFHMQLVLEGGRATFAPDAMVEAEMPDTLQGAQTQNARWERGRVEMARQYIPPLWRGIWKNLRDQKPRHAYLLLDAILEHLIPPFSIFIAASIFLFLIVLILPTGNISLFKTANLILGTSIILAQIIYTFSSLLLVKAPKSIYKALFYAPIFVLWKIGVYLKVFSKQDQKEWIRTARNES